MVDPKRLPVIKWTPYKSGENKAIIMKEINQIVSKKEHRRKVGLELGALREFKGNTHWNLFVDLELAEMLYTRINGDLKNVFIQSAQGFNTTKSQLNNITEQLKKTEYNLSNVTTLSSNNMIKVVQNEVGKLNKLTVDLAKLQKGFESRMSAAQSEIEQTSNLLKDTIAENFKSMLKELSERTEATQKVITDDISALKEFSNQQFKALHDQAFDLNTKSTEEIKECSNDISTQLSEKVLTLTKDANELQKQLESFREVTNNRFDEQQSAMVGEFQEGVGGLMKQNLDNFEKLIKDSNANTKEIVKQLDDSTENLTSIFEATNAHMDKINENINTKVEQTEEQFRKEINTEITDLRAILSTIRSDIELMKSVLTKIDSKVH